MNYSHLIKVGILLSLAIPQSECFSEEYYVIGTADSIAKQQSVPYASSHGFYIYSSTGNILKYGDKLPNGYVWLSDNRLQLPSGVILEKNGVLTLPNNKYPEQYDIKSDGSVIAPNGVVLKPKTEEKKQSSSSENKDNPTVKSEKAKSEEKEPTIEDLLDFDRIFAEEKAAEEAKKKGKNATPVSKKGKKPVSVAEKEKKDEKPAPKVKKRGDKFEIPDKAYQDKDLAFLEGCWKSDTIKTGSCGSKNLDQTVYYRFCFDKNGRGQRSAFYNKKEEAKGAATAQIKNNKLVIIADKAYREKSFFSFWGDVVPSTYYCNGVDEKTKCRQEAFCPDEKIIRDIYLKRD